MKSALNPPAASLAQSYPAKNRLGFSSHALLAMISFVVVLAVTNLVNLGFSIGFGIVSAIGFASSWGDIIPDTKTFLADFWLSGTQQSIGQMAFGSLLGVIILGILGSINQTSRCLIVGLAVYHLLFLATNWSFENANIKSSLDDDAWFWILYSYFLVATATTCWLISIVASKMIKSRVTKTAHKS